MLTRRFFIVIQALIVISGSLFTANTFGCELSRIFENHQNKSENEKSDVTEMHLTEDELKEIHEETKMRDEECISKDKVFWLFIFGGIVLLCLAFYICWLLWRKRRLNRASFRIQKVSFRRGNRNRLEKA